MSLIYLIVIENFLGGVFQWGRFADFAQIDILIAIIWFNNWRRWRRLKRIDKKNKMNP